MLSKKNRIKEMFNSISLKYDLINQMMTFNMDKQWRQIVFKIAIKDDPKNIIDIATGTGDIALCFAQENLQVVGIDNASQMLDIARQKSVKFENIQFQMEDAEEMSFEDNLFDVATVGFGVRNFENLHQGLLEIKRVLKPGKKLVILETAVPSFFLFRLGYFIYTKLFIPLIGKIFANNHKAYNYLSSSAEQFPHGKKFQLILEEAGFENVSIKILSLGIVNIYSATKPQ